MSTAAIAVSGSTAQAEDFYQSVPLNRYHNGAIAGSEYITDVATNHPDGQYLEKSLGHIWPTQVSGTRAIYQCYIRYGSTAGAVEFFTSIDPNCETHTRYFTIGYVKSTQIAGLVPLYRCRAKTGMEIFDSLDAGCEGQTVQGRLGYVAPSAFIIG